MTLTNKIDKVVKNIFVSGKETFHVSIRGNSQSVSERSFCYGSDGHRHRFCGAREGGQKDGQACMIFRVADTDGLTALLEKNSIGTITGEDLGIH